MEQKRNHHEKIGLTIRLKLLPFRDKIVLYLILFIYLFLFKALAKCDNAILKVSGLAGGWGGDARVDEHGWHWEFQRDYVTASWGH